MNLAQAFAQGARCGHIEGRSRCSIYVIGEEYLLSYEAAENQQLPESDLIPHWAAGYRLAYRLGASGEELPEEYKA